MTEFALGKLRESIAPLRSIAGPTAASSKVTVLWKCRSDLNDAKGLRRHQTRKPRPNDLQPTLEATGSPACKKVMGGCWPEHHRPQPSCRLSHARSYCSSSSDGFVALLHSRARCLLTVDELRRPITDAPERSGCSPRVKTLTGLSDQDFD